jgi:hypothetical protein
VAILQEDGICYYDRNSEMALGLLSGFPVCCIEEWFKVLETGDFSAPSNLSARHRCCPAHIDTPFEYDTCGKCGWYQVAGHAWCRRCEIEQRFKDLGAGRSRKKSTRNKR